MGLRVNNNIQSVNGHRNLQRNDFMVGRSMEKLSSGLRVNRAADDSAGLIISEQMRAQITGLNTAISNSETAVNMVQTAEGALDEVNNLLNKARSLALHAANEGANDTAQLVADQSELDNIIDSVTRIAENTQFGTKTILDGGLSSFRSNSDVVGSTQTGDHYAKGLAAGTITRGYHSLRVTTEATRGTLLLSGNLTTGVLTGGTLDQTSGSHQFLQTFTFSLDGHEITVASGQTKNDLMNSLNALGKTLGFQAYVSTGATVTGGAFTNQGTGNIVLQYDAYGAQKSIEYSFVGGASGASALGGTHTAGTNMVADLHLHSGTVGGVAGSGNTSVTLTQTGLDLTLVSTVGANAGYKITLNAPLSFSGGTVASGGGYYGVIDGMSSGATFQVGANKGQTVSVEIGSMKATDIGVGVDSTFTNLAALKGAALTGGFAQTAIDVIDKAIADVTAQRGELGAFQANTLETGINSMRVSRENLTAAESTIRDVDFAEESAKFSKYQILVQSSTAMLAQANQLPQNVMQLLG